MTRPRLHALGTRVDPGVGQSPGPGTPNDDLTLFDFNGRALPALRAYTPEGIGD